MMYDYIYLEDIIVFIFFLHIIYIIISEYNMYKLFHLNLG